jgi:hypothetical protein
MPPPLAGDFAVNVSMVYDLPGVRVPPKQLDGMGDNNLLICAECGQSVVVSSCVCEGTPCFSGHTQDKLAHLIILIPIIFGRESKKIPDH